MVTLSSFLPSGCKAKLELYYLGIYLYVLLLFPAYSLQNRQESSKCFIGITPLVHLVMEPDDLIDLVLQLEQCNRKGPRDWCCALCSVNSQSFPEFENGSYISREQGMKWRCPQH